MRRVLIVLSSLAETQIRTGVAVPNYVSQDMVTTAWCFILSVRKIHCEDISQNLMEHRNVRKN